MWGVKDPSGFWGLFMWDVKQPTCEDGFSA